MAEENKAVDKVEEAVEETTEEIVEEVVENQDEESLDEEVVENQEDEEKGKEKKFFGKKKKEKKDPKDEKIADLTDRLQRQMAEFDNFRKRTTAEKASMYVIGAKEVVEKLLPIVDNFERALAVPDTETKDPFVEGMNMIYKQFLSMFDEIGVKQIEALGKEFDPNLHNAVMHVEDEEVGENIIVEEFQKGYMYKEFVVRHSMVKVAN